MKLFTFILFSLPLLVFSQEKTFIQYVDPFIGTGGHGHTFPGATTPFGMVQLSPDTRIDGSWDGCSGYHYSDSIIYGFSHTHLSGTGVSDWGDILLMPTAENSTDRNKYSSKFSHKNERASAGFYSVKLPDDNIDAEMTATTRAGFHKYTFNNSGNKNIILDLTHRDKTLPGTYVKITDDNKIEGCRVSEAWAQKQFVYFSAEFSEAFYWEIFLNEKSMNDQMLKDNYYSGQNVKAIFSFKNAKNKTLYVKVGISSVSIEGAKNNLHKEIPEWDFEKTKRDVEQLWNKELSKIEVASDEKDKLKIFYTALYHCMIHPSTASDTDGKYRGMDNKIYTANGFTYYSVFSLWDTFRALHPLLTIIDQKRTLEFIKTFLEMYKQTGRLPVWELSSNETDCMIGYHAVSVMTDAYVKGIKDFDTELAMKAMLDMSNLKNYRGLDAYKQKGFLEVEDESESVSKTLEYAYNDWCIAQFAKAIGKDSICNVYRVRAQSWKNIFNPETGFMQPRSNGGWLKDFDPNRVDNNFTEGNSWQYSFFVPHDINGLIQAIGSEKNFEQKLDELFTTNSKTTGREQADITGLIGQYAHGNEPSHHMAYLYNYVGKPEITQQRVKQILDDFYKPSPDGLIGNEDCGQMSAWYIMSSLGFYSVCPGNSMYLITKPAFENYVFHLKNGKSPGSKIITSLLPTQTWINQSTILQTPQDTSWDYSEKEKNIPSPIISSASQVFSDSLLIEIKSLLSNSTIEYDYMNPGFPILSLKQYSKPFYIKESKEIYAVSKNLKNRSKLISAKFYKRPNNWKISISSQYNLQYTAGGDEGLIDGLRGDENWRKGRWQGYQGQDFECIIDLGKEKEISKLSSGFLQDTRSWILMPAKIEVSFSVDGKKYSTPEVVTNNVKDDDNNVQIKNFEILFKKQTVRFVKIKAYNYGKLPSWHAGAGVDAFIFIDEISIE